MRNHFSPLLARRLPTVLYGGFKHGFIADFVQRHKGSYPYFVKCDIEKFYPSLSHRHLMVAGQMAYKKLLGLQYVPRSFSRHYLFFTRQFFATLPSTRGIPLNSSMSKSLAPLLYVPFFLDIKTLRGCKFIVYADDVLFLCSSRRESERVYYKWTSYLESVDLRLNLSKVVQGRFSTDNFDYCGFRYAGGYVSVADDRVERFRNEIRRRIVSLPTLFTERAFIKNLNRKISGFGHFYKYGSVKGLFQELDGYVRSEIRSIYKTLSLPYPNNGYLQRLGLLKLADFPVNRSSNNIRQKRYSKCLGEDPARDDSDSRMRFKIALEYAEQLTNQNKEIIALLKQLLKEVRELNAPLRGI